MSSAAVIGRQLRQQNPSVRTSGPLVPPQPPYKGRPRTPSHHPGSSGNRPYSPAGPSSLTGTSDRVSGVLPGAQVYPPHQPHDRGKKGKKKDKEEDAEPKLKCTWHCFCIAIKALSGGLILLLAGTVMSIVGFVGEASFNATATAAAAQAAAEGPLPVTGGINNGTDSVPNPYKNLTYAGPVIMGLGGIVIVAACVLTFEVRDTLGVKVAPVQGPTPVPTELETVASLNDKRKRSPTVASISSTKADLLQASSGPRASMAGPMGPMGKGPGRPAPLSLPLAIMSDLDPQLVPSGSRPKNRLQETALIGNHHEPSSSSSTFRVSDVSSAHQQQQQNGVGGVKVSHCSAQFVVNKKLFESAPPTSSPPLPSSSSNQRLPLHHHQPVPSTSKLKSLLTTDNLTPTTDQQLTSVATSPSSESGTIFSNLMTPNVESVYFGIPSPQETECSDPDGCSLQAPSRWRSSRCSCSASPSHSIDLYLDEPPLVAASASTRPSATLVDRDCFRSIDDDNRSGTPINAKLLEQQRLQQQLIIQQQMLLEQQQQQLALQRQLLFEQRQRSHRRSKRPKTIASVESDGLSSSDSSEEGDLYLQTTIQVHPKYQQVCDQASAHSRTVPSARPVTTMAAVNVHRQPTDSSDHNSDPAAAPLIKQISKPGSETSVKILSPGSASLSANRDRDEAKISVNMADARSADLRQGSLGNGSVHKPKS
ncbi:hypothetical protein HDE_05586 [Halotydeus destructor]|nr:hypothetical protein HDE_05586 [Halotydeus destructor]